jgi:hypothetical protein
MRIPIKVVLEEQDGQERTETIVADSRDVRAYEAEFDTSFLTTDLSVTQITQLAFCALRRQGRFRGSWDVFDSSAVDVEGVNAEEGEVDTERPTQPALAGD